MIRPVNETPGGRYGTLTCAVLEQSRQLCLNPESPTAQLTEEDCPAANCRQVIEASCHEPLDVDCNRHELDLEEILENASRTDGSTETVLGRRTYCTDQVPVGGGYALNIPADPIQWECSSDDKNKYLPLANAMRFSGRPLLGYPVWSIGYAQYQTNICRQFKAVVECVLPNIDPSFSYDRNTGEYSLDAARCPVPQLDGSDDPRECDNAYEECGTQYLSSSEQELRDFCFRIGRLWQNSNGETDLNAHQQGRAMDLNNGLSIGQWNSGTVGASNGGRPAQLTLPPRFVSIMEGCGFTWGGRFLTSSVGDEPGLPESCDPMHFELPVAGGDQASADPADTVVVLDSSGSMGWNDPQNQRKNAAKLYLDTLPGDDRVAAIDFDSAVRAYNPDVLDVSDPDQRSQVVSVINSVDSSGGTNIGTAVARACEILNRPTAQNPLKAAIVLTDGQDSVTDEEKECFLYDEVIFLGSASNGIVSGGVVPNKAVAPNNGWTLHVLGFGGAVQSQLDAIIADTTPGSTADIVGSAEEVLCRMLQLRAVIAGDEPAPCTETQIGQGQTVTFEREVTDAEKATFSIAWAGTADIEMTLIAPSGRVIDPTVDAPDLVYTAGSTFASFTLDCPEAGVWTIELFGASIPAGLAPVVFGTSEIEGESCGPSEACGVDALGAAGGFNAFVVGDVTQDHTHIGGRVAAGGDVDFEHVFVGAQLGADEIGGETLVAGAHLRFDHGRVQGGDVVYGLSADVSAPTAIVDGVVRQGTPIGFAAAGSRLVALAARVSALPATADPQIDRKGNITLIGLDEQRNVFHVGAEQLADAKIVLINVPETSTAVVVVDGASVVLDDLVIKLRGGADAARIAWALPDALDLLIAVDGVSLPGAVLAPRALVDFAHGRVDGTLVGAALYGDGKLDHVQFEGCLPQP